MTDPTTRDLLVRALAWADAHVRFDDAVAGVPRELRGVRPGTLPHSPWEVLEHLRITQRDILDFCRDANYQEKEWPKDYWPGDAAPPDDESWDDSVRAFIADREALQQLVSDPAIELTARIPHGTGQTYLREAVLVIDHAAYHVGQLVLVRRLLGIWKR